MARRDEGILSLLATLPWWISVCVGIVFYVGLKFIIPSIVFDNPVLSTMASLSPGFAWISVIFLLPAAESALKALRKRRRLDRQAGIESIRSLSWKQFEELLGEAYRRQGYVVRENTSRGPDGGVDLSIKKGGNRCLVQCKQWRQCKVGVKVVREMYGLMTAEHASGAIIVTSGFFTQEAKNFAAGKPVDLVEGSHLVDLIRSVQRAPRIEEQRNLSMQARPCPLCGNDLLVREARRGPRAGSKFWGCSGFPKCRYTEEFRG
jgi:restriction system protein